MRISCPAATATPSRSSSSAAAPPAPPPAASRPGRGSPQNERPAPKNKPSPQITLLPPPPCPSPQRRAEGVPGRKAAAPRSPPAPAAVRGDPRPGPARSPVAQAAAGSGAEGVGERRKRQLPHRRLAAPLTSVSRGSGTAASPAPLRSLPRAAGEAADGAGRGNGRAGGSPRSAPAPAPAPRDGGAVPHWQRGGSGRCVLPSGAGYPGVRHSPGASQVPRAGVESSEPRK